jgi:predicted outer membrane repeat protein
MSTHFASKTGRVAAGGSLLVGGVAGALLLAPQAGAATTYTVTNTLDSGAGSLRQAVDDANNNAGADIIVFDASAAGTITLTTGEIAIRDAVSITGLGAVNSIISGNNNSRIFYIYDRAASLTVSISGLTMTDGSTGDAGGAILSNGNDLTLSSVVITGNEAEYRGGGVYFNDSEGRNPSFTIIDSEISDNTAGNDGGGFSFYNAVEVTITNTVVSGNSSDQQGGGAYLYNVDDVSIASSTFDQNTAVRTGGGLNIYEVGDVTITNTVVSGNTAGKGGGAFFYNVGNVSIDSSTFDQNTSVEAGGGIDATQSDSFTMTNSTVSGNQASDGAGLSLYLSGEVLIANSTIANNVADSNNGDGGALYSYGSDGDIRIIFCTISGNSANGETVRLRGLNDYGVDLTGTIISDNATISGSGTSAVDLFLDGSPTSELTVSSSLIMGTIAGDPFTDGGGNVLGVSAQLGVLADNGGATFTMEPAVGSSVIDAGPLSLPSLFPGSSFDQRGTPYTRGYNARPDIGAFETQPDPVSSTTTSSTSTTSTTTAPTTTTTLLGAIDTTTTVATDPVAPAFTG